MRKQGPVFFAVSFCQAIAAADPAHVVKLRFDEDTTARLLKIRWWDWDNDRIERALPLIMSQDIAAFLRAAEAGEI